jgi:hypothetical protein
VHDLASTSGFVDLSARAWERRSGGQRADHHGTES